tara:strand:- start:3066 stop:3320 length:255 start_codon:yes stop_codon:yes gene_type:complete
LPSRICFVAAFIPMFSLLSRHPLFALAAWATVAVACTETALLWKVLALFPDARRPALFLALFRPTLFTILMSGFMTTAWILLGV